MSQLVTVRQSDSKTVEQQASITVYQPNSLAELIERFLQEQDVAASSKATYRRQLRQFVTWLEETGRASQMASLDREDILIFKQHLQTGGLSSYSVSGYLTAVRKLYAWLESRKVYPNIAKEVKGAKKAKGFRKDSLTPGQLREALAAIDISTLEGLRDFAIFNLLARTGLRTIEISRARVKDLRQEAGEAVLWIQGKGRDEADDFVLLTDESLRPIRQYLSARSRATGQPADDAPLFASCSNRNDGQPLTTRSISRLIKQSLQRVDIDDKRLTAHSLRHTAITLSIKGGASLQQAQAMARHSDPRTTMIYFHNLDRIAQGAERYINF
jgi:integrase/recombinase XerD